MAISLLQAPTQARLFRKQPLPKGVVVVLRIVAGDEDAIAQAAQDSARTRQVVVEASIFFVEQMMLCPEADSYRVLGAGSGSSTKELRQNMTLLLRWLHPDVDGNDGRSVFAHRVTRAWNDLKTDERRNAYDRKRTLRGSNREKPASRQSRGHAQTLRRKKYAAYKRSPVKNPQMPHPRRMGFWNRVLLLVFGRVIR